MVENLNGVRKQVGQIATEAGKILQSKLGSVTEEYKSQNYDAVSIQTEADLASEAYIVSELRRLFPEHGIYAEEAERSNLNNEYVWYVDPLDGTGCYTRGLPLYGVSIGLVRNRTEALVGAVALPGRGIVASAAKGFGTFVNNERVHVSNRPLEKSLYYAGGYYQGRLQWVEELAKNVGMVKIIDASAHELVQIAIGEAEIYLLTNVPHDVAAGIVLIEEAGGRVTDETGKPWSIDSDVIVATNGVIHDRVLHLLPGKEAMIDPSRLKA